MDRKNLNNSIKIARKETLDLIQAVYGETNQWLFVRKRLLKIFGDTGLGCFFQGGDNNDKQREKLN